MTEREAVELMQQAAEENCWVSINTWDTPMTVQLDGDVSAYGLRQIAAILEAFQRTGNDV